MNRDSSALVGAAGGSCSSRSWPQPPITATSNTISKRRGGRAWIIRLTDHRTRQAFNSIGLVVAYDIVGGFFAIDGGGLGGEREEVRYLVPDTLQWEGTEHGHGAVPVHELWGIGQDFRRQLGIA